MAKKGIDVSVYQGNIDWEKVKPQIDFAIIRLGYGGNYEKQDDTKFLRNATECERLGIPYGVYLFSYADSIVKAQSEAEHTLRLLKGRKLTLPVWYDLEDDKTTGKCSNDLILQMAKTYVSAIEKGGYTCGIYANCYWNKTKLTNSWYDTKPRWIAQYNSKVTYDKSYLIWQYSSKGAINGIVGNVDMNYYYGEINATQTAQTTTSTVAKKKTVSEVAQEVIDGKWGNGEDRKTRLTKSGYNYAEVQKKVNELLLKKSSAKPVTQTVPSIKVGDTVKIKQGAKTYDGKKLASFVYGRKYKVKELKNDRAVLTFGGIVICAMRTNNITKV